MKELSYEEMEIITGGSWLGDAWNWIKNAVQDVVEFIGSLFYDAANQFVNDYSKRMYDYLMRGGSMP